MTLRCPDCGRTMTAPDPPQMRAGERLAMWEHCTRCNGCGRAFDVQLRPCSHVREAVPQADGDGT